MLQLTLPSEELWDEKTQSFIYAKEFTLSLEHSLVSISKWEAKWHVPFLSNDERTAEQVMDYVKCMTITQNVDDNVYSRLTAEQFKEINAYIENPMTATTFTEHPNSAPSRKHSNETVTSELIYYWMVALQIPFKCEKWHINRLLTLIRVCNIKNAPDKKMSKNQILKNNHALNEARKRRLHTRG